MSEQRPRRGLGTHCTGGPHPGGQGPGHLTGLPRPHSSRVRCPREGGRGLGPGCTSHGSLQSSRQHLSLTCHLHHTGWVTVFSVSPSVKWADGTCPHRLWGNQQEKAHNFPLKGTSNVPSAVTLIWLFSLYLHTSRDRELNTSQPACCMAGTLRK